jgi:hypothetical protein
MDPKMPNLPSTPIAPFEPAPEMEVWETPFDRWARLADVLLRQVPASADKPNARKRFTN